MESSMTTRTMHNETKGIAQLLKNLIFNCPLPDHHQKKFGQSREIPAGILKDSIALTTTSVFDRSTNAYYAPQPT
eukprot:scaffold432036_cov20-Prasinocladus_malaysianus.AAC.1